MRRRSSFYIFGLIFIIIFVGLTVSPAPAKQWKLRSADVVELASPYTRSNVPQKDTSPRRVTSHP